MHDFLNVLSQYCHCSHCGMTEHVSSRPFSTNVSLRLTSATSMTRSLPSGKCSFLSSDMLIMLITSKSCHRLERHLVNSPGTKRIIIRLTTWLSHARRPVSDIVLCTC